MTNETDRSRRPKQQPIINNKVSSFTTAFYDDTEKLANLSSNSQLSADGRTLGTPNPPDHWREKSAALKEWKRIVPELVRLGLIAKIEDREILVKYCELVETGIECYKILRKQGRFIPDAKGEIKPHPALLAQARIAGEIRQISMHLGLSPASRKRVSTQPNTPKSGEDLLDDEFFGNS